MTRKSLKKLIGQNLTLSARIEEISGHTPQFGNFVPTILLKEIHHNPYTTLTDHVWISPLNMAQGEPFPTVKIGDIVRFNCTITSYQRENHHRTHYDATLDGIRKFEIISSK